MGKNQEERKTPVIVVKKRRTFSPPSLSEKTDIIAPVFTEQIGRASCRESVKISVDLGGRRIIKKKKKNKKSYNTKNK